MTLRGVMMSVAVALVVGAAGGLVLGLMVASPKAATWPKSTAPSIRQRDGSLVAERRLDPSAKPAQALPRGAKPVRMLSAVVTPQTNGQSPEGKGSPQPVTVDVTLTDDNRAVISSPNGTVVTATDVWIRPPVEPTKNTLITGYNWSTRDAVAGYARRLGSIGPVTFKAGGLVVYQDQKPGAYALLIAEW